LRIQKHNAPHFNTFHSPTAVGRPKGGKKTYCKSLFKPPSERKNYLTEHAKNWGAERKRNPTHSIPTVCGKAKPRNRESPQLMNVDWFGEAGACLPKVMDLKVLLRVLFSFYDEF